MGCCWPLLRSFVLQILRLNARRFINPHTEAATKSYQPPRIQNIKMKIIINSSCNQVLSPRGGLLFLCCGDEFPCFGRRTKLVAVSVLPPLTSAESSLGHGYELVLHTNISSISPPCPSPCSAVICYSCSLQNGVLFKRQQLFLR